MMGLKTEAEAARKVGKPSVEGCFPRSCSLALGDGRESGEITGAHRPDFPAGWECQ